MKDNDLYNVSTGGTTRYDVTVMQEETFWDKVEKLWKRTRDWWAILGIGMLTVMVMRIIQAIMIVL